jgi:DnaJ-domain-containing protein 1
MGVSNARSEPPSLPAAHTGAGDDTVTRKRRVSTVQAGVIDAMYESLRTLDDREVLSVAPDADSLEIRCAYEALLAAFHPRRFAQTALGEHGAKLEAILQRVHAAYAALTAPDR